MIGLRARAGAGGWGGSDAESVASERAARPRSHTATACAHTQRGHRRRTAQRSPRRIGGRRRGDDLDDSQRASSNVLVEPAVLEVEPFGACEDERAVERLAGRAFDHRRVRDERERDVRSLRVRDEERARGEAAAAGERVDTRERTWPSNMLGGASQL